MKLILLLLFFLAEAHAFTCNRPVNANKIVFFVDTRNSRAEVESASRSACARGETFQRMAPPINVRTFRARMNGLAGANKAVSSLIVSGHDGGGSIHDDFGNGLNKNEIIQSMRGAYSGKPALLNQFRSVYLWGCWTNGPGEVAHWRTALPSLKVIGGFIDMAPINTAEASHTILRDLLLREQQMIDSRNIAQLRRSISSVQHINQTYAAVYVEACDEEMYYYNTNGYAGSSDPNMRQGTHFVDFQDTFTCERLPADYQQKRAQIMRYYLGELPIPTNTASGELRQLYSFARTNSRCLARFPQFNADRLMLLMFFENVKKNFARLFAADIARAARELRALETELNTPNLNRWDLPVLNEMKAIMAAQRPHLFTPDARTLATKNRVQIRRMISGLNAILAHRATRMPANASKFLELRYLRDRMEKYLFQLDPQCMDFLQWHEYMPGRPVTGQC